MPELENLLEFAAGEVLETMFYSAVYGPGTEAVDGGPHLSAGVSFTGSLSGALAVSAPYDTARALAAAFLGEGVDTVPDSQVPNVMGELANVLCGVVLGRVEAGGHFVIAPPQISQVDAPMLASPNLAVRRTFAIEEGTLSLGLTLDAVAVDA